MKKIDKRLLIALMILAILELIFIPILVLSGIKKILPIIAFIIIPVILSGLIFMFSRSSMIDVEKKKLNTK